MDCYLRTIHSMPHDIIAPRPLALLNRRCDGTALGRILLGRADFRPYPVASDRAAWGRLPATVRDAIIAAGEKELGQPWETLRASVLLGYVRTGNRADYEAPHALRRARLTALVLAECAEGRGRFLDAIADGVWTICEETFWGGAAHLFMQKRGSGLPDVTEPTVDLGVGETAALLAWTHYLLAAGLDLVHPMLRERIALEIDRRVLTPCLERDDFWWMGWHRDGRHVNNWNPWCCSNWLACVLLLEADPDRRTRAVHKVMRILDTFIDYNPADGGCDEGPAYWGRAAGSLFDCLELLHAATAGNLDLYAEPLIRAMGRFVMVAHAGGPWFVNFADAPARPGVEGMVVHRYGRRIGDPALAAFGAWVHQQQPPAINGSLGRVLPGLWLEEEIRRMPVPPPLPRDTWLPALQVMMARDAAGSDRGFFVAAKGGHNDESGHNQNDCGTFLASLDGQPLLIDIGVETYTAKTFSPQRYEIWTMQSQWHNLPTVNGHEQRHGREFAARSAVHTADDKAATLQLDLTTAWPAAAGIQTWTRTVRLERNQALVVIDDYALTDPQVPAVFHFLTTRPVDLATPGLIRLGAFPGAPASRGAILSYDAGSLAAALDEVAISDPWLKLNWGDRIFRLQLTERVVTARACREFRIRPRPDPSGPGLDVHEHSFSLVNRS